jgi:hypothetical protein
VKVACEVSCPELQVAFLPGFHLSLEVIRYEFVLDEESPLDSLRGDWSSTQTRFRLVELG